MWGVRLKSIYVCCVCGRVQVTIWDWAKQSELVTGVAPQRFKSGGFNPQNPDQLIFLGDGALYMCNVVAGASGPEFEVRSEKWSVEWLVIIFMHSLFLCLVGMNL